MEPRQITTTVWTCVPHMGLHSSCSCSAVSNMQICSVGWQTTSSSSQFKRWGCDAKQLQENPRPWCNDEVQDHSSRVNPFSKKCFTVEEALCNERIDLHWWLFHWTDSTTENDLTKLDAFRWVCWWEQTQQRYNQVPGYRSSTYLERRDYSPHLNFRKPTALTKGLQCLLHPWVQLPGALL